MLRYIINNCQNVLVGTSCKLLIEHDPTTNIPPSFEYEVIYGAQSIPKSAKVVYEQEGALLSNIDNLDSLTIKQDNAIFLSNVLPDQNLHISKVEFIPDNGFGPAIISNDSCSGTDLTPSTGCSFDISSDTDTAGYISLDGGATHFEHINISGLHVTQNPGTFSSNTSQAQTYQAQYIISNKNGLNPISFRYTLDGDSKVITEDSTKSTCHGITQLKGGTSCSVVINYTAPKNSPTDQNIGITVKYTDNNNHPHSIHSDLVTNVNSANIVGYKSMDNIPANSQINHSYTFEYTFKNIGKEDATGIRFANFFDPNTITLDKASTCMQSKILKPNQGCIIKGTFIARKPDQSYYLSSNLFYNQGHYVSLNNLTKSADQTTKPIVIGAITTDVPANNIMLMGTPYTMTYKFSNIGKAVANNLQFINTLPLTTAGFSINANQSTCSKAKILAPNSSCDWIFAFNPTSTKINTSIISNLHYDNGNNVILSNENLINNHKIPPTVLENKIIITRNGDNIPSTTHNGQKYSVTYNIQNNNSNNVINNLSIPALGGPLSRDTASTCISQLAAGSACTIILNYQSNTPVHYSHDISLYYDVTDGIHTAQTSKKMGTINTTTTDVSKYILATPKVAIPENPKQYKSYPFDYIFKNIGDNSLTNVTSDLTTLTADRGFTINQNTCQSIATMNKNDTCETSGIFYPAQQGLIGTADITLKSDNHNNLITVDLSNDNTLIVQGNNAYPQMAAANYGGCIIHDNKLYCYGAQQHNRFGNIEIYTPKNIYTPPEGKILKTVNVSMLNTCVIIGDPSTTNNNQLYCRGLLPSGPTPYFKKIAAAQTGLVVKQVASNAEPTLPYMCTIEGKPGDNTQDMAFCWGYNTYGELGNGKTNGVVTTTPTKVDTTNIHQGYVFKYIRTSNTIVPEPFTCAIVGLPSDELHNQVYCWGNNTYGYLGLGNDSSVKKNITIPTKVDFGHNASVSQLVTTWYGGCVLMEGDSNQVQCWGGILGDTYNYGFPGNGEYLHTQYSPAEPLNLKTIVGSSKIIKLVAGNSTVCYLTNNKTNNLNCWGANLFFQLGNQLNNSIDDNKDPTEFKKGSTLQPTPNEDFSNTVSNTSGFKDLYIGAQTTCGLAKDDKYYCWGRGTASWFGQPVGTNTVPTKVTLYPLTIPSP